MKQLTYILLFFMPIVLCNYVDSINFSGRYQIESLQSSSPAKTANNNWEDLKRSKTEERQRDVPSDRLNFDDIPKGSFLLPSLENSDFVQSEKEDHTRTSQSILDDFDPGKM